jgi:hypothetical protein
MSNIGKLVPVEMLGRDGEFVFSQEPWTGCACAVHARGDRAAEVQSWSASRTSSRAWRGSRGSAGPSRSAATPPTCSCRGTFAPGQVNFSQRTLDEYSDDAQVNLEDIVTGLGGDFVNAFPVPPTKMIRLTHKSRPGYTPTKIAIDLEFGGWRK